MVNRDRPVRVGVVGVQRGRSLARGAGPHLGMELAALCDVWEEKLREVGRELNVATYADYDRFLARVRAVKVGLTYACLLMPELPAAAHDVPVDVVVTELSALRTGAGV